MRVEGLGLIVGERIWNKRLVLLVLEEMHRYLLGARRWVCKLGSLINQYSVVIIIIIIIINRIAQVCWMTSEALGLHCCVLLHKWIEIKRGRFRIEDKTEVEIGKSYWWVLCERQNYLLGQCIVNTFSG